MMLICDDSLETISIGEVTKTDSTYALIVKSADICPKEIDNLILDYIENFKWIIFAIGMVIGPLELLIGEKIFNITIFFLGSLISALISVIFCDVFLIDSNTAKLWAYLLLSACILLSLMVGIILVKLTKLGLAVCGATGGFFLCILLNYLILWRIDS